MESERLEMENFEKYGKDFRKNKKKSSWTFETSSPNR